MDNIQELKRKAVNAMTGHMPCTPDTLYELGKALESVCEEVERCQRFEEERADLQEKVTELKEAVAYMKSKAKTFALEMETA